MEDSSSSSAAADVEQQQQLIDRVRGEILAVRAKRLGDRRAHSESSLSSGERRRACQDRIFALLLPDRRIHRYKQVMTDAHGGLDAAPPRYALELEARLLSAVHRGEAMARELGRMKKSGQAMERYMKCVKLVLVSEKEELEASLATLRPAVQDGSSKEERLEGEGPPEQQLLNKSDSFKRSRGFMRELSPASFFKRSFTSGVNRSLNKLMGGVSPPSVWVQPTQE